MGTLFRLIGPWRRQLILTVTSGVGRVYALITVSTLSALTVAAIKTGTPFGWYVIWMAALLIPLTVLTALAFIAWPTAVVLLPFLVYAALAPVFERRKVDALGGQARAELGGLNAHLSAAQIHLARKTIFNQHRTLTVQIFPGKSSRRPLV